MRTFLAMGLVLSLGCRETMKSSATPSKTAMADWEKLLERIVDERGLVDYDLLESERGALDGYVAWLGSQKAWPGRTTKDWHAQYLNAYNALVLYQVLERGRPASVLDVRSMVPLTGWKFFHATQFPLGDDRLTLSEIENERIRWKEMDYRDHAAMNCASMSCPPLRNELYRTPVLDAQLDDQFRRWMNDEERGVRLEGGQVVFSPIFDWFERDFAFFSAGIDPCTLAAAAMDDEQKRDALYELAAQGCPRTHFGFDWSLNAAPR